MGAATRYSAPASALIALNLVALGTSRGVASGSWASSTFETATGGNKSTPFPVVFLGYIDLSSDYFNDGAEQSRALGQNSKRVRVRKAQGARETHAPPPGRPCS